MELITKKSIRTLVLLSILTLATTIVHAQPSIPVGLYIDCNRPSQLQMSFRNRGSEFTIPKGLLPWNNIFAMKLKAFALKDGKASPLALYAPVSDHMNKVKVFPNDVISGSLSFGDAIKDFDSVVNQSEIIITYNIAAQRILHVPVFKTAPIVIVVPKRLSPSSGCPQLIPVS